MVATTVVPLNDDDYDYVFKIILLGDISVGKTSLMSQFTDQIFSENSQITIQPDFRTKNVKIGGKNVKVTIFDTSGQERFLSVTSGYYRHAHGALLVYDITNYYSFENSSRWFFGLQNQAKQDVAVMLVGNKSDLDVKRAVPIEEATTYAEHNELYFIETSAKEATNVETGFIRLVTELCKRVDLQPALSKQNEDTVKLTRTKSKKKCPC